MKSSVYKFGFIALVVFGFKGAFGQTLADVKQAEYNEQPDKALSTMRALVTKNPGDMELNFRAGLMYYQAGKKDSAQFYWNQGMKVDEKFNYNLAGLGLLALDNKNAEGAQDNFDKLENKGRSKDYKAYLFVGEAYASSANKNDDKAIENIKKASEVNPNDAEPYLVIAPIYLAKGDGGKAVTSYEYAIEKDPKQAYAYMKIGQIYMMSRNYEEALKHFTKSNEIDPNYAPVYRELGEFDYYAKKYADAAAMYKKYIDLSGTSVEKESRYASFLFLSKDYPKTISIIESIIQKDSSNAILSRLIGYSYFEQGKYQDAANYMQKFFTKVDTSKIIGSDYAYLGKSLAKIPGNDSIALVYLYKAIAADSTNDDLYTDLANTLMVQNKFLEAAQAYQKKMDVSRPNSQDNFLMGKAYYYAKEFGKADTAFGAVNDMQPTASVGYLWRARANAQLDPESDKGLALPYYQKFIELATDESRYKKELVEAYSYVGYYDYIKKDIPGAKAAWQKVKELDPENQQAIDFFKGIK